MSRHAKQQKLVDSNVRLPNGLIYKPNFLTESEEEMLLTYLENMPLQSAKFREYKAKRKVKNFGWSYDFDKRKVIEGPVLPKFLQPIQIKIAKWLDIPKRRVVEALVTEYPPGSPIGWHRDTEDFEHVVGISLNGWCEMRFRPYRKSRSKEIIALELEPRSAYVMQKEIRWQYEHSIPPTKTYRYSITFRTLSAFKTRLG